MKHPGRWLWLLLLLPIAVGLARLRFNVEVFDLLPGNLPVVAGLKLYQQHFASARELIITVQAAEPERAETTARMIAEDLRKATNIVATVTWLPPWLEHPDQAAELLAYLWLNQPPDKFNQLADRLAADKLKATLDAAREELATSLSPEEIARLSYDPFGLTRLPESAGGSVPGFGTGQEMFSSSDGTFRIIFVKASTELRTYRDCEQWLNAIKQIVDVAPPVADRNASGVTLGYTGRPAFVAEIAGSMQHDITASVGGTALIIAALFWLAHRRWKPMLWLLTLLALILASTLGLGGLIFGTINVVSMGFAAILLGLAVDYAVVHYQEALTHPGMTIPQIRGAIAPSIFWAAVTTISAFLVLNFGGLPGLGQLGTLVGLGVALSACIMIFEFLPPLFPERRGNGQSKPGSRSSSVDKPIRPSGSKLENQRSETSSVTETALPIAPVVTRSRLAAVLAITNFVFILACVVLMNRFPPMDSTANALRPRKSPAYTALDLIKFHLNEKREPLWLIISSETEKEMARKLDEVQPILTGALSNSLISSFTLPTPLWPRPEFQAENRATARRLAEERAVLRQAALTNGFTETALGLSDRMLDTWQAAAAMTGVFWPTNQLSHWIFEKLVARTPTNYFALGLLNPMADQNPAKDPRFSVLESDLLRKGAWLSGWELLGNAIFSRVKANMWKVLTPMVSLVFISLLLAFRRSREVLLSLSVLLLSALCLLTVMRLAGWSWNLLNLMALPLVLGTGVDYSIFMQLALRRHHGDLEMAYRAVGRALLLCGGTAIAGFGSLAWSSNAGMASLGQVCAVGIASNMLISIYLLPVWWRACDRSADGGDGRMQVHRANHPSAPSSLYRSEFWQLGLWLVRVLPLRICTGISRIAIEVYCRLAPGRRNVVIENLAPALDGNGRSAKRVASKLFQNFGLKLIDLWRYEAGLTIDDLLGESTGWEHFVEAQEQKRGVLFLTPHLGNWEFGAPWLTRRGFSLQVITLAEPGKDFTRLRQASRARWKVETLVIGNDPFAFLEVIRRLEAGATVALLVDRPPPPTAVTVELFGRPFAASIAAAELARASGCVLLPVYLPRLERAYSAHILPPIPYDRGSLRDRQARQQLTQQIMRAFEPIIRQHLDQWYHFVPIWPES